MTARLLLPPDWAELREELRWIRADGPRYRLSYWKVEIDGECMDEYRLIGIGPDDLIWRRVQRYCPETARQRWWRKVKLWLRGLLP